MELSMIYATIDVYRKTSNIRRTLVGNLIVDHSDVVGASPVGAAYIRDLTVFWYHLTPLSLTIERRYETNLVFAGGTTGFHYVSNYMT